jgi:uncharacterized membrane protein YfcA
MTLILSVQEGVARDFSLMIQSIGMVAASFTILYSRLLIETTSLLWSTVGGTVGIIIGLKWIEPRLPNKYVTVIFVSIWLAFSVSHFVLNVRFSKKKYKPLKTLENVKYYHRLTLIAVGIVGGILGALTGGGLDICTYSVLTILFRVSEKTATPTSVVLMSINTVIGFFYRWFISKSILDVTWTYFFASIPIVPVGAPLGAWVSSYLHRFTLSTFLYLANITQYVLTLIIIPAARTTNLLILNFSVVAFGLLFFGGMGIGGEYLNKNKKNIVELEERTEQLKSVIDKRSRPKSRSLQVGNVNKRNKNPKTYRSYQPIIEQENQDQSVFGSEILSSDDSSEELVI